MFMFIVPAKLLLALLYTEKCAGFDLKLSGHPTDREEGKEANFIGGRKESINGRRGKGKVWRVER